VTLEDQALAALKSGDLPAAAAAAQALISAAPEQPAGFFLLGIAAAEAGQIAKAVPLIEAAVERGQAEHLAHSPSSSSSLSAMARLPTRRRRRWH
jgi:predicted TPR repeat methyltransferase